MDGFEAGMTWVFGYLIGILIGMFALGSYVWSPDEDYDFSVVCQYEGGEVQGDICLKNDRSIEVELNND